MKVLKFGGSSLASPQRIRGVAAIVADAAKDDRVAIVVSAMQGVTDQLLAAARDAERGSDAWQAAHRALARRHHEAARRLAPGAALRDRLDTMLDELREVLRGIRLLRHAPPRALDHVGSFGERLSAPIVAAHLVRARRPAEAIDARELVVTDDAFTHAAVLFDPTNRRIRRRLLPLVRARRAVIPVITGFVGATADGRTTTIGRNGSDYTAAIFGAALGASAIEIWTDVDGILSADPSAVPGAFVIERLSYEEAMELSYFGAKVLHSATLAPAVAKRIPILIKNTMNPAAPGTTVSAKAEATPPVAKGITSIDGMALLTLRGLGMVGVPGTAERLFRALAAANVSVILISQASSEHTICFAIKAADAARARRAIEHEFRYEFRHHTAGLDETPDQSIAAIVGEGMKGTPGVAGRVFESLGRNQVSIAAIAQGASERNISFVVPTADKVRTLRVVHEAFFERRRKLTLVVVGATGNIGRTLLDQLAARRRYLLDRGFDVRLGAVANRRGCALAADGLDLAHWREALGAARGGALAPERLAEAVHAFQWTNAALVDCTASADVVAAYPAFVRAGLHIVTPNKQANVLPTRQWRALHELLAERRRHFLYEANVGAGLPVISTLQDLVASGDTVTRIEGIFSGTLAYLFSTADGAFSERVKAARDLGFTEPDPREDLSGRDVARKLLVLARLAGATLELGDVRVEDLVPRPLRAGEFQERFFADLARWDAEMAGRHAAAKRKGRVLRYTGVLEKGRASAGLTEYPLDHPLATGRRNDNIIAFTTARYASTPLVVQGPGAGADVTAMGVFSDLLKLLHYLPA